MPCTDPADDPSSSDRLQGSRQAKDPPVSLSQLDNFAAHVLQTDAVPPLPEVKKHSANKLRLYKNHVAAAAGVNYIL